MATKHFEVLEHVIPAQHIREYHNAINTQQEDELKLAIKQYVPKQHTKAGRPKLTLIATHANGFPKEMYGPLWDDLHEALRERGLAIQSIWFADSSHQGASGVLNENNQGDEPSYFDHSRDMLLMINTFRKDMARPLVGVAHSMGCAQIVQLSLMHPRLFTTLILMEPVIQTASATPFNPALPATMRPDLWRSREEAEDTMRKAKIFRSWDPRMLNKFLQYSFRETPTALYPEGTAPAGSVTLTTTKHQEAWTYVRGRFHEADQAESRRLLDADAYPDASDSRLFWRPECNITLRNLPYVRPTVLWMFGSKSPMAKPEWIEEKMTMTGTGAGGSGGAQVGCVQKVIYEKAGHFLPCEQTSKVCHASAEWLDRQMQQYEEDEALLSQRSGMQSDEASLRVSEAWIEAVKKPASALQPKGAKL